MLNKISLLAAAALVAGSFGYAAAQSSPSSPSKPGAASDQTKCWDAATKQIKDKSAMKDNNKMSGSGSAGSGSSTTGAADAQKSSPSTGAGNAGRPPQAAGLPNC